MLHHAQVSYPGGVPLPMHPRSLRASILHMLRRLAPQGAQVEFVLVRDRESARLNSTYLNYRGPTNCLSFPASSPDARTSPTGTVFLSLDALRRECLLYGQEPAKHLLHLSAHALAHLVGFDHGPEMRIICEELENMSDIA